MIVLWGTNHGSGITIYSTYESDIELGRVQFRRHVNIMKLKNLFLRLCRNQPVLLFDYVNEEFLTWVTLKHECDIVTFIFNNIMRYFLEFLGLKFSIFSPFDHVSGLLMIICNKQVLAFQYECT